MDINEFIKKFCKNCKETCDRGIIECEEFIRCVDKNIYISKIDTENKSN